VSEDVVAWTDARYRTIPRRSSRGLVGHSMGGFQNHVMPFFSRSLCAKGDCP